MPCQCLSVHTATIRKPAATFYFFGGFCRYMTGVSIPWGCAGRFVLYSTFLLKVRTLSLWPVVFLSPSAAMVLPFLLQTCAVFSSHVKFQEWAFLLETCNQKGRQESSFSIQNYAAGAKSFSQFILPSCQLQRGGLKSEDKDKEGRERLLLDWFETGLLYARLALISLAEDELHLLILQPAALECLACRLPQPCQASVVLESEPKASGMLDLSSTH